MDKLEEAKATERVKELVYAFLRAVPDKTADKFFAILFIIIIIRLLLLLSLFLHLIPGLNNL